MKLIRKDLDFDIRQAGGPGDRILEFIGSTGHVDRYGDVIEVEGWDLRHYKKNPVFLWAHDYRQPPIGKALKVEKTDKGLLFRIKFPTSEEYPFADTIYKLYLGGYMRATSVGFQDLEREPITDKEGKQTGWRYKRQELYELSAVPVPANPQALIMAVQKGVVSPSEMEEVMGVPFAEAEAKKGVIPFKEYPTEPEDAPWDGPAEVKAAEVKDLKVMCAWYDSENPDIKASYKLPHHRAKGYNTVWRGVAAAMAAMLGARGGVNIPEADRKGVYNHLAKHYAQFEKEPPEFKEYGDVDLVLIEMGLPPLADKHLAGSPTMMKLAEAVYGAAQEKGLVSLLLELIAYIYDWLTGKKEFAVPVRINIDREVLKQAFGESIEDGIAQAIREGRQKSASLDNDIYSLALNPGTKPQGGRPAKEPDINQLMASTVNKLQHLVKGGN
ncbi:MAG: HK97 family phage prohead protease [Deltaproteobacteria bacterium]|nr:HK97 family phage prohead protease [Deltaproteobacteria bacterium]